MLAVCLHPLSTPCPHAAAQEQLESTQASCRILDAKGRKQAKQMSELKQQVAEMEAGGKPATRASSDASSTHSLPHRPAELEAAQAEIKAVQQQLSLLGVKYEADLAASEAKLEALRASSRAAQQQQASIAAGAEAGQAALEQRVVAAQAEAAQLRAGLQAAEVEHEQQGKQHRAEVAQLQLDLSQAQLESGLMRAALS